MTNPKNSTKTTPATERKNHDVMVKRAKFFEATKTRPETILFDLEVGDVMIYNCRWVESEKDGKVNKFVGFPSTKGKDGKYYNIAYVPLSDEDVTVIEKMIEKIINPE